MHLPRRFVPACLTVLTLAPVGRLAAQKDGDSSPAQTGHQTITLDLDSAKVGGRLPFDEWFALAGKASAHLLVVRVQFKEYRSTSDTCPTDVVQNTNVPDVWQRQDARKLFVIPVEHGLHPGQDYRLCVGTDSTLDDSVAKRVHASLGRAIGDTMWARLQHNAPDTAPHYIAIVAFQNAVTAAIPIEQAGPGPRQSLVYNYRMEGDTVWRIESLGAARDRITSVRQSLAGRFESTRTLTNDSAATAALGAHVARTFPDFSRDYLSFEHSYHDIRTSREGIASTWRDLYATLVHLDPSLRQLDVTKVPNDLAGSRYTVGVQLALALPNLNTGQDSLIAQGAQMPLAVDPVVVSPILFDTVRHRSPPLDSVRTRYTTLYSQFNALVELTTILGPRARAVHDDAAQALGDLRTLSVEVDVLAHALDSYDAYADSLANTRPLLDNRTLGVAGTTAAPYKEATMQYVSADLGFLWAFGLGNKFAGTVIVPYVGANFYLLPTNGHARFNECGEVWWQCQLKRVAITFGITTSSVARTNVRTDLFGSHSMYVALGYRLLRPVKINAGALLYDTFTPDIRHAPRFSATPALSGSIDWDIGSTLGGIGSIFK